MLTISKIARIAEAVIQEAEALVVGDPGHPAFYVELEGEAAADLEFLLGRTEPTTKLLLVLLKMSVDEWAVAHPHILHIQVKCARGTIDLRREPGEAMPWN